MLYVKQILHSNGKSVPYFFVSAFTGVTPMSVVIHDTVSGNDSTREFYRLENGKILGYGTNLSYNVAVCLESKHLLLHKYVRSVSCDKLPMNNGYFVEDTYFCVGQSIAAGAGRSKFARVIVNRSHIDILGMSGSAVLYKDWDNQIRYGMTLYDLLVRLCKDTGTNLMAYDGIRVVNYNENIGYLILLHHDHDADIFFTKMLLDGVR